MSKLTLGRMAKLYGLHRSTLYEAVQKGRVSAGLDGKGQRVIDLSEMIRVYGEPPGNPTPKPDTPTDQPDSNPTPAHWAEMLAELRLLREEVAGLRKEMRLIGHEGVQPQVEDQPPVGEVERPRAQSFADLLDALR
ncbi:hypothetical protein SAMN05444503_11713 [Pseudomonas sp. BS3767]|uniref:hypothetical protein n=1 Tax=Pseudomonas TaxID=286 RepID=UPI0008832189|nr:MULTISPECIES: hypothetical protein [Pseudomonas]RXU25521.1 hypothetical protein B0A92_10330 [Pseudomonas syringae]SDI57095.1 hypothetical protein SAMN05444503_11713 [Pseudomonas sp. BS3767]